MQYAAGGAWRVQPGRRPLHQPFPDCNICKLYAHSDPLRHVQAAKQALWQRNERALLAASSFSSEQANDGLRNNAASSHGSTSTSMQWPSETGQRQGTHSTLSARPARKPSLQRPAYSSSGPDDSTTSSGSPHSGAQVKGSTTDVGSQPDTAGTLPMTVLKAHDGAGFLDMANLLVQTLKQSRGPTCIEAPATQHAYNAVRAAAYAQSTLDRLHSRHMVAFTVGEATATSVAAPLGSTGTASLPANSQQALQLLVHRTRRMDLVNAAAVINSTLVPNSTILFTGDTDMHSAAALIAECLAKDGYVCLMAEDSQRVGNALRTIMLATSRSAKRPYAIVPMYLKNRNAARLQWGRWDQASGSQDAFEGMAAKPSTKGDADEQQDLTRRDASGYYALHITLCNQYQQPHIGCTVLQLLPPPPMLVRVHELRKKPHKSAQQGSAGAVQQGTDQPAQAAQSPAAGSRKVSIKKPQPSSRPLSWDAQAQLLLEETFGKLPAKPVVRLSQGKAARHLKAKPLKLEQPSFSFKAVVSIGEAGEGQQAVAPHAAPPAVSPAAEGRGSPQAGASAEAEHSGRTTSQPVRLVVTCDAMDHTVDVLAKKALRELRTGRGCLLLTETDLDISKALRVIRQCADLLGGPSKAAAPLAYKQRGPATAASPATSSSVGADAAVQQAASHGEQVPVRRLRSGQLDTTYCQLFVKPRLYPDVDDSPYFSLFPTYSGLALQLQLVQRHEVHSYLAATPTPQPDPSHTNYLRVSMEDPALAEQGLNVPPAVPEARTGHAKQPKHGERPWPSQLDAKHDLGVSAGSMRTRLAARLMAEVGAHGVAYLAAAPTLARTLAVRCVAMANDALALKGEEEMMVALQEVKTMQADGYALPVMVFTTLLAADFAHGKLVSRS